MCRRAFLAAVLGVIASIGALSLSGCADVRQRIARTLTPRPPIVLHASLSTLPKAPSIPTGFDGETVQPLRAKESRNHPWPTNAMIEIVHGSFLIAYGVNSDDETANLSGGHPILVDLKGSTTYGIVPEDLEHGYRIEPMTVPPVDGVSTDNLVAPSPGTLVTGQFTCTATCDDKFVHLTASRKDVLDERPENQGRVSLLKIRPVDRRTVTSALLGRSLALKAKESTYRAGSSITLISGGADLLVTTGVPYRTLRLSAKDPSMQFNLTSVTSQNFCAVSGGGVVTLLDDNAKVRTAIVTLVDDLTHLIENLSVQLIHQGYLCATDSRTKESPYPEVSIDFTTDERTELTDLPVDKGDKHLTSIVSNGYVIRRTDHIQVRKDDPAIPLLTRESAEGGSYQSAAIYGSILYPTLNGDRLHLIDLDTDEMISQSPTGGQHEVVTVAPYGFCSESTFYPTTAQRF